jgi:hypothetical protein
LAVLATVTFVAAILAWGVGDSQKRGQPGWLFIFLFVFLGPLGIIVWLIARPSRLAQRSHESYGRAEDALAAASSLDQLGEWDHAIALYESIAHRWPGHKEFVVECQKLIKEKQSLA